MDLKSIHVGNERFSYTGSVHVMPKVVAERLIDTLEAWTALSPYEPTYVMREYGVPSLIARFDGVLGEDGEFRTFEIQGGCSWIGYAGVANSAFREIRDELARNAWPRFKFLAPPSCRNDDELWLERITLTEALRTSEPLMIRKWLFRELPAEQRMMLLSRSVKPIFHQNDKRYGINFGWWREVYDADMLPWDTSFVLKPRKGDGSSDVMIWNASERRGRATRTQITEALSRNRVMYIQQFIPPMEIILGEKRYNTMYRPFFGYDPRIKRWTPMHGVWIARPYPNLRLHGASDAISGPLIIEQNRA